MNLSINGWDFSTDELAQLPPFTCEVREPARTVLGSGDILAQRYIKAECRVSTLARELGIRYQLARQALAWYGIKPAERLVVRTRIPAFDELFPPPPKPLEVPTKLPEVSRHTSRAPLRYFQPARIPPAGTPAGQITRGQLRSLVARVYLSLDRCPPGCLGVEDCMDPGGKCVYQEV